MRAILYRYPAEMVEQRSDEGRFRSFVDEASCAAEHSLNWIMENPAEASKESITIIKPREDQRKNL